MSSSSAFHVGDVASAIQGARASARPLLVALHPGGDSASLDAVWADDDVRGEVDNHWVAVCIEASTAAHRNFAQIYPTHASRVPSVVALNPNDGSVLFASGDGDAAEQGVGTNVEATRDVLRATRAAFQKAMAAAAMAALARMAAATGAGSDAKTETTPSARTMSTTPGATAPSASASDPATDPSRETRADADERATNANAKAVSKKKTLVKTASLSAKGEVPVARPRTPSPIALRVTLADGSTIFGELPAGATLGDARACIVANEPHVANEAPFEIWNTWPRERLDGGEEGDARAIDAQTLESLGLGGRPSLLVIRPLARRGDANEKPRKQTMTMTNAARAAFVIVIVCFRGFSFASPLLASGRMTSKDGRPPRPRDSSVCASIARASPSSPPSSRSRGQVFQISNGASFATCGSFATMHARASPSVAPAGNSPKIVDPSARVTRKAMGDGVRGLATGTSPFAERDAVLTSVFFFETAFAFAFVARSSASARVSRDGSVAGSEADALGAVAPGVVDIVRADGVVSVFASLPAPVAAAILASAAIAAAAIAFWNAARVARRTSRVASTFVPTPCSAASPSPDANSTLPSLGLSATTEGTREACVG